MADASLAVGDSQMRRIDLVALRKRIQNALGPEKWQKYWGVLQRFIRFKLSKEELDNDTRAVLGSDNVALHNQLIRGIYQNAIINTVHPPAVETQVAPDPFEPPTRPEKKKKKKAEVSTAGSTAAAVNKAAVNKKEPQERFSHDMWLHQQEMQRTLWIICDGADLYDESLELPSFIRCMSDLQPLFCECMRAHIQQIPASTEIHMLTPPSRTCACNAHRLRHNMRKRCRDFALDVPQEVCTGFARVCVHL
jgi:hypothetical protein